MDLASVVAALASVGVRVSGSTPNNNVQGDSSRACPTGLAGPEPSGTINDPGQHFQLRGGWLGCTRAFVRWHLWPYPLKFSLWSTATTHPHCHCTPRHPRARARSPRLVKPRHGWLGLAWYGMVWLGARARCFHNGVR